MRYLILGAAALALSSCALAPRDACTRDWFAFQADDIQRDFVRRNRAPVRRMRDLQSQFQTGFDDGIDPFAVLALASAKKDVSLLVDDFRGSVVPRARNIAATCELDQGYDMIINGFLANAGVDARLVEVLGLLGQFEGTPGITQALTPVGTAPIGGPVSGPTPLSPSQSGSQGGVQGRPGF